MPVYNGEKYLVESINSILSQTYSNFEFIIINDGSTDNSENIILSFKDKRIRYIKNDKNIKLNRTLNIGVECATGKYISRMDSDDIAINDMLELEISVFNNNKIDIVNALDYEMTEDGKYYYKRKGIIPIRGESLKYTEVFRNMMLHPGIMVRASLLKFNKYSLDPQTLYMEDYELWNRLLYKGARCFWLNKYVIFHRDSTNSISNIYLNDIIENSCTLSSKYAMLNNINISRTSIEVIKGYISGISWKKINEAYNQLNSFIVTRDTDDFILRDLNHWKNYIFWIVLIKKVRKDGWKNFIDFIIFFFNKKNIIFDFYVWKYLILFIINIKHSRV